MKWIGLAVSVVGYLLAILGAWLLYRNAPPDLGAFGNLVPYPEFIHWFDPGGKEVVNIEGRAVRNKQGFWLIAVGCFLQMVGTIFSAFA